MSVKSKNTDPIFYNSLDESEKNAWWLFEAGIKDRKSYFHTPVVVSKLKRAMLTREQWFCEQ